MKFSPRNSNANVAQVHQKNILDRLHHRLDAAKANSDEGLVQQLEGEMQQVGKATSPTATKAQPSNVSKVDVTKAHHHNLLENVKRRLEVARAKGDSALVSQLERELQQLA